MVAKLFLETSIKNSTQEILIYVDKICDEIFFSEVFNSFINAGKRGVSLKIISNNTEDKFQNVYTKYFDNFQILENSKISMEDETNNEKELNQFFVIDNKSLFYNKLPLLYYIYVDNFVKNKV